MQTNQHAITTSQPTVILEAIQMVNIPLSQTEDIERMATEMLEKFKYDLKKKNHGTEINFTDETLSYYRRAFIVGLRSIIGLGIPTALLWGGITALLNYEGVLKLVTPQMMSETYSPQPGVTYIRQVPDYAANAANQAQFAMLIQAFVTAVFPFFGAIQKTAENSLSRNYATDTIAQDLLRADGDTHYGYNVAINKLNEALEGAEYDNIRNAVKKTFVASQYNLFSAKGALNSMNDDSNTLNDYILNRVGRNFIEDFIAGFVFNPTEFQDFTNTTAGGMVAGGSIVGLVNMLVELAPQIQSLREYNVANVGVFEKKTSVFSIFNTLGNNLWNSYKGDVKILLAKVVSRIIGRNAFESGIKPHITENGKFPNIVLHCFYEGLRSGIGQQGAIKLGEVFQNTMLGYFLSEKEKEESLKTLNRFFSGSLKKDAIDLVSLIKANNNPSEEEINASKVLKKYHNKLSNLDGEGGDLIRQGIRELETNLETFKETLGSTIEVLVSIIEHEAEKYETKLKQYKAQQSDKFNSTLGQINADIKNIGSRPFSMYNSSEEEEEEREKERQKLEKEKLNIESKIKKLENSFELPDSFTPTRLANLIAAKHYFEKLKSNCDTKVTMAEIDKASSYFDGFQQSLHFALHDCLPEKTINSDSQIRNIKRLNELKDQVPTIFRPSTNTAQESNINRNNIQPEDKAPGACCISNCCGTVNIFNTTTNLVHNHNNNVLGLNMNNEDKKNKNISKENNYRF